MIIAASASSRRKVAGEPAAPITGNRRCRAILRSWPAFGLRWTKGAPGAHVARRSASSRLVMRAANLLALARSRRARPDEAETPPRLALARSAATKRHDRPASPAPRSAKAAAHRGDRPGARRRADRHGDLPFHLGPRILRLCRAGHDGAWRLEAVCALHRLELPVPGRRQPVPRAWQAAYAGAASSSASPWSPALRWRSRSSPISRCPAPSSSSASCTRSRWPACSGWRSCGCRRWSRWPIAALVIAAPFYARSALFDHPWWWWLGLSPIDPRSNDYVPIFPWFGAVLAGIAAARLAVAHRPARAAGRAQSPSPLAAAIRRAPQPRLLPHPPAGADRLRLGVRAILPGRDRDARGRIPPILRGAMCGLPRRGVLHALLCVHARRAGSQRNGRRGLFRRAVGGASARSCRALRAHAPSAPTRSCPRGDNHDRHRQAPEQLPVAAAGLCGGDRHQHRAVDPLSPAVVRLAAVRHLLRGRLDRGGGGGGDRRLGDAHA